MSKVKTLLFSFVPLLIAIALQVFSVFYLLFVAAIFLFAIAPNMTEKSYTIDDLFFLTTDTDFNTVAMIIFSFCCMILFGIWYKKRCSGTFRINLKKEFHPYELLGILFLIPGAQYVSALVASLISIVFPSWMEAYEQLLETAGLGTTLSTIMFIYSVVMAPISEELIFRGVIFRIAQRSFPFWTANVIQAALFGAFHMNAIQGCYTFFVGLVLGYICQKGGSIYHAIVFHILFNLWGTTVSLWLADANPIILTIIMIASLLFGLSLGFYFFKLGNEQKHTL